MVTYVQQALISLWQWHDVQSLHKGVDRLPLAIANDGIGNIEMDAIICCVFDGAHALCGWKPRGGEWRGVQSLKKRYICLDASDVRTFSIWLLTSFIFRSMLSAYTYSSDPQPTSLLCASVPLFACLPAGKCFGEGTWYIRRRRATTGPGSTEICLYFVDRSVF